jgi:hypothetical protein
MKTLASYFVFCALTLAMQAQSKIADYNVEWHVPSSDSWGSMPAGNGDIGVNAWMDDQGCFTFLISKTDAWSENARLLKIGKLGMEFEPNLFADPDAFRQRLEIDKGRLVVEASTGQDTARIFLWVDAYHPVVHVDIQSNRPLKVSVTNEIWRTARRALNDLEMRSAYGLIGAPFHVFVEPDHVEAGLKDQLQWYHRNERSIYELVLEKQGLQAFTGQSPDPLQYRTFGATVHGTGFVATSPLALVSGMQRNHAIDIWVQTAISRSVEDWKMACQEGIDRMKDVPRDALLRDHLKWWRQFWDRHWIFIQSETNADSVFRMNQGYLLQRYIHACGGRGDMPIKFNGSIFTVDLVRPVGQFPAGFDADFRNWGGCYWFQNTRLPYWSMLHAGDFSLMKSLFAMYLEALDLARFRTRAHYAHDGACYPETMYFWGSWNINNYGWEREGLPEGISQNKYIRHEWQGGLELLTMMLDYHDFTQHSGFLADTLMPLAWEILLFYDRHYQRNGQGRIVFDPAQALETYWEGTINPMPEIAGLRSILPRMMKTCERIPDHQLAGLCESLWEALPDLPLEIIGKDTLLAAAEILGPKGNIENPELYAIFPYRLFGVGKPQLGLARESYARRLHKDIQGWQQDAIQAACLGKSEEAARMVLSNLNTSHAGSRFPAFWGPNYDWIPDQDHGSVNMRALQNMIVQTDGRMVYLLPAWPDHWNVDFRVHAPLNTVITGTFRDGKITDLHVDPPDRLKDITILK